MLSKYDVIPHSTAAKGADIRPRPPTEKCLDGNGHSWYNDLLYKYDQAQLKAVSTLEKNAEKKKLNKKKCNTRGAICPLSVLILHIQRENMSLDATITKLIFESIP